MSDCDLWKERTEQGAKIIEGNCARIGILERVCEEMYGLICAMGKCMPDDDPAVLKALDRVNDVIASAETNS